MYYLNVIDNLVNNVMNITGDKFIEYCILSGIIVLVIMLISSILGCFKSIKQKDVLDEKTKKLMDILKTEVIEDENNEDVFDIKEAFEQMKEVLDNRGVNINKILSDDILEDELEKTSIISYKELKKSAQMDSNKFDNMSKNPIMKNKVDEILLDEADDINHTIEIKQEFKKPVVKPVVKETTTFKPSEFISPIYGLNSNTEEKSVNVNEKENMEVLKNTTTVKNYNDKDILNDISIAEELLKNLKELKKSLE